MPKYKKIIATLVILAFLVSYFSYLNVPSAQATDGGGGWASAAAGWASYARYMLKEFVIDLAARFIANSQLKGSLKGIAGQVLQSGRTGRTPSFIQNWRNLITDGQYRGEDVFKTILSNTTQCPYFRKELRDTFGVKTTLPLPKNTNNLRVNNLDPFTTRGNCTMPQAWSIQNYQRDFSGNGGWDALARLSQPQNNFYGSMLMSLNEVNSQRGLESRADTLEAGPTGFVGIRRSTQSGSAKGTSCDTPRTTLGNECEKCTTANIGDRWCFSTNNCETPGTASTCTDYTEYPGGCSTRAGYSTPVNSTARCTFLGSIATPADILGKSASQFIDKRLSWFTTSDELAEVLGNYITGLVNQLSNYAASAIEGKLANPEQDRLDACIKVCDKTSKGQTLSLCYDACYKSAGVNGPDSCNWDNTCPPSSVVGAFCDGKDIDLDGNNCDASIGENNLTCPSDCPPVAECQDGLNNDNDFDVNGNPLIDAPGIGLNPDPDCSSPFDNSESGSVATFQCNDGIDNDGDTGQPGGGTDYPADSSCTSATDDSEITLLVRLCAGTNYGPPCETFTSSNQDLGNPMTTIGPDNAESFDGVAIIYNPIFVVELCVDPGYGNCTTITSSMLSPPGQVAGGISDLNSVPSIGRNTVQSIKVCQNGQDPVTKACLP